VEYVLRLRKDFPNLWVFWVDAKNEETFLESYSKLAERAQIPGWNEVKVDDIPGLVSKWLENALVSPWLLLLDGNDDANMLFTERATGTGKTGKSESIQYLISRKGILIRHRFDQLYSQNQQWLRPHHFS
jgi:hypothetical protein